MSLRTCSLRFLKHFKYKLPNKLWNLNSYELFSYRMFKYGLNIVIMNLLKLLIGTFLNFEAPKVTCGVYGSRSPLALENSRARAI